MLYILDIVNFSSYFHSFTFDFEFYSFAHIKHTPWHEVGSVEYKYVRIVPSSTTIFPYLTPGKGKQLYIIPVTMVNQDQSHSVIQFAPDRTELCKGLEYHSYSTNACQENM